MATPRPLLAAGAGTVPAVWSKASSTAPSSSRSSPAILDVEKPDGGDDELWAIKAARQYGLTVDLSKKASSHVIGFDGQRLPKDSELVAEFVRCALYQDMDEGAAIGDALYRTLAAATHGLAWVTNPHFSDPSVGPAVMSWAVAESLDCYGALVDTFFGREVVRGLPAYHNDHEVPLLMCSRTLRERGM